MVYLFAVWDILLELAPWLLFGMGAAAALHVLVPSDFIARHLGKPGLSSSITAAFVGVPLPLCSCSVIPTGIGLYRSGAGKGASLSFLISTPQTGVDSIAVTAAFLGWPFALFKVLAAFLTGVIGGALGDMVDQGTSPAKQPNSCSSEHTHSHARGWRGAWHFAVDDVLRMIWKWLLFGVFLSALLNVTIEPHAFATEGVIGGVIAMLIALAVSLPLYVCATASVPIAAALVQAGLPTGAALVFLMAGPATNIATIGAISRALGWRSALTYLTVIIIGSVSLGLCYDAFIGLEASENVVDHEHEHTSWWAIASVITLIGLMLRFAIRDAIQLLTGRSATATCCTSEETSCQQTKQTACCSDSSKRPNPSQRDDCSKDDP